MTGPVATLTANEMPDYWAAGDEFTVRIDGPLPIVREFGFAEFPRRLWTGDRVRLASPCGALHKPGTTCQEGHPFATATVKSILGPVTGGVDEHDNEYGIHCLIEVTDVEALT